MKWKKSILWMLLLLWLATGLRAVAQVESNLSYRRYTTLDGLPQMQAERLWQDSRGYIYIGTLSGFVRFDGREFTPFLKGKRYNIVGFGQAGGQVWALSFRQRWQVGQDELQRRRLCNDSGWLLNNFNSGDLPEGLLLLEDEQEEHRWIGRMDGQDVKPVMESALMDLMTPDRRLFVDSSWVYIPTAEGLFRTRMDAPADTLRLSRNDNFYTLCRQGATLYAFAQDGIYTVEGDSVRLHTAFGEWETGYGLIVRDAGDELLVADEHTLYSYDGRQVRRLHGGVNLIKDIMTDRWGRLWVATYQGVYCFFNRCFTNQRLTDGDDIMRAVATTPTHTVAGSLNGKILVDGKVVYDNPEDFFLPSAAVVGGAVYMAGRSDVACVVDSSLTWLRLPYERYQFVAEAHGRIVLGLRQLIATYDPESGRVDTLCSNIPHPWCAAAGTGGSLYVGSTFGLFRLSLNAESQQEAEPVGYEKQKLIVTTMEADSQGAVFFASGDSLFLIRKDKVQELNSQMPQLQGHEVRSLHVSPRRFLVVAAIDGLFVARIGEDYQLSDVCFFNHLNGFTTIEPLKATMAEAADGTVWLCGVEEATTFRPEELIAASQADTFIRPPLHWYEHWWAWLLAALLVVVGVWALTRWYDKVRSRRKMLRLQREKQKREELIRTIRREAIKAERTKLAEAIVQMTAKPTGATLTLRTTKGMLVIDPSTVVYMKADGNYTQVVTFESTDTVMTGLGALAKQFAGSTFVRADRSTLVNTTYIYRLHAAEHRCIFKSADGALLEISLLTPAFKRLQGAIKL